MASIIRAICASFTLDELPQLAQEIREEVISVVSEVGGHFASTLGAVELTLALHYVFDTPEDRIVWDTGHQTYAHKLHLRPAQSARDDSPARRLERFSEPRGERIRRLRRRPCRHVDFRGAGHGGSEMRWPVGKRKVVAVISDGGLSAGLTYEGLNSAGHLDKDLIVVLNDNEHFIDPRVGAVSSFLSQQFTTRFGCAAAKKSFDLAQELAER